MNKIRAIYTTNMQYDDFNLTLLPYFLWFDLFLEARAEILNKILLLFGEKLMTSWYTDLMSSFRLLLTFTACSSFTKFVHEVHSMTGEGIYANLLKFVWKKL